MEERRGERRRGERRGEEGRREEEGDSNLVRLRNSAANVISSSKRPTPRGFTNFSARAQASVAE
jgi:hypothetical protein